MSFSLREDRPTSLALHETAMTGLCPALSRITTASQLMVALQCCSTAVKPPLATQIGSYKD